MKVFLGGTCNDSSWREDLIEILNIDYFNPVVKHWTSQCREEELKQREECDFCLYVITPRMIGVYSIAEVVDDSNKRPEKTVFCFLDVDLTPDVVQEHLTYAQVRSIQAVCELVERNGVKVFYNLAGVAVYLNRQEESSVAT